MRATRTRCSGSPTPRSTKPSAPAAAFGSWPEPPRCIVGAVQKYVLSELDSGERVISEKVPSVRSVSIGFWIGATSREHTVVFSRVPDRHVDEALQVMTDMVFAPRFAELDQEREVVLEEIAMYEDTPAELVHDLFSEAVFGSHALGRPVIGTAEVISTISRRAITAYHRAMYNGANIVVSAAGNITHDRLLSLLKRFERQSEAPARRPPRLRRPIGQTPQ